MREADVTQEGLFVTRTTADYVPTGHPLVAIRDILNRALREMDLLFESIYDDRGRYSVPPEWLLRGQPKVSEVFMLSMLSMLSMLAVNLRRLPRLSPHNR